MSEAFVVTGCSQLVTLAGPARPRVGPEMRDVGIVNDGAMLVRDGRIEMVGSRDEVEFAAGVARVVDVRGRVVTPGFVDAHTHPVFGGNRVREFEMRSQGMGYEEIAASGGGIRSTVAMTRSASDSELLESGRRHRDWFLRCGTTTIEAKSGYGLSLESELRILRTIRALGEEGPLRVVPTFLGAHALPPEFEDPESCVDCVIGEMLPVVASEGLAEFCDVFCEKGYFEIDQGRRLLVLAKSLGLGLRIHADQLTDCGGAALAAELGAKTADHLEQTATPGIEALLKSGTQPVLLPASVYCLGKTKYPAAREMIDRGLAVVLATDFNPGSSPTPSMPFVLSLACTQMRMSPAEAFTAATINAAYCLNRGGTAGSLEPGKGADFVVWDCEDYREIAYFVGAPLVQSVYVAGQAVL